MSGTIGSAGTVTNLGVHLLSESDFRVHVSCGSAQVQIIDGLLRMGLVESRFVVVTIFAINQSVTSRSRLETLV